MKREDLSRWPESAAEIAEVIGTSLALYLISQLPVSGSRPWRRMLYVPKSLPVGHFLHRTIDWHPALKMSRAFAGMILQPANCRGLLRDFYQWAIPDLVWRDGLSIEEVAELTYLSPYRVREIALASPLLLLERS